MVATAGISLTLDPMGKVSQNASSLKPLGQFKPNCPRMIIGRSSTKFKVFYADRTSKMADLQMIIPGQLVSIVQVVSEKNRFETFFP
jgi:hypothetical protein